MKHAYRLLVLTVIIISLQTLSAQTCNWLRGIGGTGNAYSMDITTDEEGNTYVTGYFDGAVTFGTISLTTGSYYDVFVARINSEGVWQWAVQAGGTSMDAAIRIRQDVFGKLHIAGCFEATATFGSYAVISSGGRDVFTATLDSSGVWLWAVSGGGSGDDCCNGVDCDNDGNSYITGSFTHTATFGSTNLFNAGASDIFVAKVTPAGSWGWAVSKGSSYDDGGNDIAVDGDGMCYITGCFADGIVIAGTTLISGGSNDILVAKLRYDGVWLWGRRAGSTYNDNAKSIALDGSGNLYIAGEFMGMVGFGSSVLSSNSNTTYDMFVAKLTPSGNWIWANCANGSDGVNASRISADSNGNCCVTGTMYGSAGFGTTELEVPLNAQYIYFAKLTTSGAWAWAFSLEIPSPAYSSGNGIDLAEDGTGRLTGWYYTSLSIAGVTIYSTGGADGFVIKFADPIPDSPQNLIITNLANDIHLSWDAVTTDNTAHPLDPDYYFIYYNYSQTPGGDYSFLDYTPAAIRHYVHQYAGLYSTEYFYEVTAVKYFESVISPPDMDILLRQKLHTGMSRTQVEQELKELNLR